MKMYFRFSLSPDNSEKYQYFVKKSMYFEKIPRENRPEASRFTRCHNAPSYDVTGNDAGTGVKSVM